MTVSKEKLHERYAWIIKHNFTRIDDLYIRFEAPDNYSSISLNALNNYLDCDWDRFTDAYEYYLANS